MQLWIGTSGFQYPEWKGTFYPKEVSLVKMLPFYAARFPTTEVNYSFRRIPSAKSIQTWSDATPERFKFSFKAPQKITHFAKLRGTSQTLEFFAGVIARMGDKLGAVLFQLPPTLKKDAPLLDEFLASVPPGIRPAFEFRDPSWFDDDIFTVLRRHQAALCIGESETLASPAMATADFGYLRLRREDYTAAQIARWAEFVQANAAQWREVFIYFKHEKTGVGPKFAQQMIDAGVASKPGTKARRAKKRRG